MIRINQIKLPVNHQKADLEKKAEQLLKLAHWKSVFQNMTYSVQIVKRSMDARKKPDLYYVYSIDITVQCPDKKSELIEQKILKNNHNQNITIIHQEPYRLSMHKEAFESSDRPVIIGSGPAGLFCAYVLASAGCRPIILERGEKVEERRQTVEDFWNGSKPLNPDSNVQFGEGGAGTFSDGKLNTLVKDSNGRNHFVLDTFVKFGADPEIRYINKPHLGTDELTGIVRNMRNAIIELGGEFHFETHVDQLLIHNGQIKGVRANHGSEEFESSHVVLAIGHSARDTFQLLKNHNISMYAKAFAVGIRIEHPQLQINECQYGKQESLKLPAADYKLVHQASNGRSVYSFCMCPGGYVVNASSEEKRLAINGMSYHNRDGINANSALIASVTPEDFPSGDALSGIAFQRALEEKAYQLGEGKIPVQRYEDFQNGITRALEKQSLMPCMKGAYQGANLKELFPSAIYMALKESIEHFRHSMPGYNRPDAILSGVESRTSSPVRIERDTNGQSNIRGLYPCGEGAGYAGGITSAAMDGIKIAEYILEEYKIG